MKSNTFLFILVVSLISSSVNAQKIVYKAKFDCSRTVSKENSSKSRSDEKESRPDPSIMFGPSDRVRINISPNVHQFDICDLKHNRKYTVFPHTKMYSPEGNLGTAELNKTSVKTEGDTIVEGYHCTKYTVETETIPYSGMIGYRTYHYYTTTELSYPHPLIKVEYNNDWVPCGDVKGFLIKVDYHESYYLIGKKKYYDVVLDANTYLSAFSFEPIAEEEIALPFVPKN